MPLSAATRAPVSANAKTRDNSNFFMAIPRSTVNGDGIKEGLFHSCVVASVKPFRRHDWPRPGQEAVAKTIGCPEQDRLTKQVLSAEAPVQPGGTFA
jgi:hypothetical protein